MTAPFPDWLASLGQLRADLTSPQVEPAVRGLAVSHSYQYPGDVTTATLEAQIRSSPDAATALAQFTIGTPVFANDVTTWDFSLAAGTGVNATGHSNLVGGSEDGVDLFLYDILLTLSGEDTRRVAGGLFEISGQITEPV